MRLASIDVLRGMVMLIMLLDHVRERFFYQYQVSDPVDLDVTEPGLFFTRILAHLCAPIFVFLTGLSAWLYANPANGGQRNASSFLLKRGLFLLLIEATLVNFSWFGYYETLYLQVIWAIGMSMIALAALCRLPRIAVALLGFAIVFGHNLLTPISFAPGEWGFVPWTMLHDADFLWRGEPLAIKVSYPVLPWIGVILLGYALGPLFSRNVDAATRQATLVKLGLGALALLLVLRGFNLYGETLPWLAGESFIDSLMSFLNFTKYPPSLNFVLLTVGFGLLCLAVFERLDTRFSRALKVVGSAPMFFYILHLYVLLIGYRAALALFGANYGDLFAFDSLWQIWALTLLLALVLYWPTAAFARFKHSSQLAWTKYF
ncbi:DUF1624 domain-containing protein [Ferrimonas pelagia]